MGIFDLDDILGNRQHDSKFLDEFKKSLEWKSRFLWATSDDPSAAANAVITACDRRQKLDLDNLLSWECPPSEKFFDLPYNANFGRTKQGAPVSYTLLGKLDS